MFQLFIFFLHFYGISSYLIFIIKICCVDVNDIHLMVIYLYKSVQNSIVWMSGIPKKKEGWVLDD